MTIDIYIYIYIWSTLKYEHTNESCHTDIGDPSAPAAAHRLTRGSTWRWPAVISPKSSFWGVSASTLGSTPRVRTKLGRALRFSFPFCDGPSGLYLGNPEKLELLLGRICDKAVPVALLLTPPDAWPHCGYLHKLSQEVEQSPRIVGN